jgi:hypothetical protein
MGVSDGPGLVTARLMLAGSTLFCAASLLLGAKAAKDIWSGL